MRDLTPLCALAKKYETDKGGRHLRYGGGDSDTCHEYTPVYYDLLNDKRFDIKKVLEIGVNTGSSLRMWEEYFPNAEIIGFDCNQQCLFNEGRIKCVLGDQGSPASLVAGVSRFAPFDLIVDDGSHELGHQITSMVTLLPLLCDTGIYVVEDLTIDCNPALIGDLVPKGFVWEAIKAPDGIGKAHCPCSACGGKGPEQLVVIRRE